MMYGFRRGYEQVPKYKLKEVRQRIMDIFGITGSVSWYAHLGGRIEPKISEYRKLEALFREYGITDIWDGYGEA